MAIAFIGIGSNLGDRQANIDRALELLKENKQLQILTISSIIETEPEGGVAQPKYLNAVLKIDTELLPLELLSQLKMVERRLGRTRPESGSPRTMDLDILFYDDVVIVEGRTLSIPHPKIATRRFVLEGLVEIEPDWTHPKLGKTMKDLLEELRHPDSLPAKP